MSVTWTVNGVERQGAGSLEPAAFRKGDRIGATAVVRIGDSVFDLRAGEVDAGNTQPVIRSVRIEPRRLFTGKTAKAVVDAVDRDEEPIMNRYRWFVDGKESFGGEETITLSGVRKGSIVRVETASSDTEWTTPAKSSPAYTVLDSPPVVRSVPPPDARPGIPFLYKIVAEDPDGDPLTVTLRKGPPGMTLTGDTLRWEVPAEMRSPAEVEVEVSDGDGAATRHAFRVSAGR